MSFLRLVLILIGTAIGFFIGGNLTQDMFGALLFAVIALLLMVFVTKPLTKKKTEIRMSSTEMQETPTKKSGRKKITAGRVVWSIITAVGVTGVIAILNYREDQKDREGDRRFWAEQHYQQQEAKRLQQLSSSIAGRVFDRRTNLPLANASIGYMSRQGFVERARTAPDGSFRIDIPYFSANNYPIRIVVVPPGGMIFYTDKYLHSGQNMQNVNIYVYP